MAERFDYVIVGAGSAGCVLAHRLSADPKVRVALLEAGPGGWSPFVSMPRAWVALPALGKRVWKFSVNASEGRAAETWLRGRGLGGSSAVNGMIYCRGHSEDYDSWSQFGVTGWGWADMEPAFRAIEDYQAGPDPLRGAKGPLPVNPKTVDGRLSQAVFAAADALGLKRLDSLNGAEREGIGFYDHSVDHRGVRSSASRSFLRKRPNLVIIQNALAERVVFEGRKASGVIYRRNGRQHTILASREVILSAGALKSPQLLQLSGIGDTAMLAGFGIETRAHNPAVGANMGEHVVLALPHRLKGIEGHNREFRGTRMLANIARYYTRRSGVLTYGASEMGGFVRSSPGVDRPDVQLAMSPYSFKRGAPGPLPVPDDRPGFTIIGYLLRPESRGSIGLLSCNPEDAPLITPNWLATDTDKRTAVNMMTRMREFVRQPGLAALIGEEIAPGVHVQSEADMLAAFRAMFVSGLHAVGTCRMGSDSGAVVDERLRVIGLDGLRVVDASVIPTPISGNTNGPVMALAWRAAAMIAADGKR